MGKPIDSAIFLAVCTALLYSWSTANYHGFLISVRLDSDMMERSFHQVIYGGLIISFGPILLTLVVASLSLYFWSHAILPSYIDWVRGSIRSKRRVIKFRRYWIGKRISPAIEKQEKSRFNRITFYSLAGLAFIFSLAYFENKGQQQAAEILEKHMADDNSSGSMITVFINKSEKTLRYLGCGAKNCAGIEEKSNKVYYFSQSSGYSFTYTPKNVIGASSG
ncbi:hypothetical protein SIO17_08605 [Pseudoalteromonas piscicida]|uniref:Uncharacterized protein n=1 Tax=Pseudoalteromonas piscicida TaxID=43662 RepID=A0ABM6NDT8_PSEO7|nr:hypothetical protein [Pseudoalteromonas piscicida]ATD07094.1 hypothetical protein PPIS_a2066 [Pseudoalteromonas piscicida]WPU33756.1 hypothetical protein SIO17_08605 [Pseudoalteromonas piscicida]